MKDGRKVEKRKEGWNVKRNKGCKERMIEGRKQEGRKEAKKNLRKEQREGTKGERK